METPHYFFSVIRNVSEYCKQGKNSDLDKLCFWGIYENQKEFLKNIYKGIWNEYENGFFTKKQLKLYLLYKHLTCPKFFVTDIKTGEVRKIDQKFSKEQYQKDKEIIQGICRNINIKNIKQFFKVTKESGENVAEDLVKREVISPIIFMVNLEKIEFQDIKFKRVISKLKETLEEKVICQRH